MLRLGKKLCLHKNGHTPAGFVRISKERKKGKNGKKEGKNGKEEKNTITEPQPILPEEIYIIWDVLRRIYGYTPP